MIMLTSYDNQNSKFNEPEWYFLAESPLSVLMVDAELRGDLITKSLLKTIRELGIPPEHLSNIERTLTRFAKKAMTHLRQGRPELPIYVRLFCQKKTIKWINSTKSSSQFNAEQTIEPAQILHQSNAEINGGWGYFLVERGGSFPPSSSMNTYNLVDLYLYKEGE